jgi:hypothetical protein
VSVSSFVAVASFAGEGSEKGTDLRILKSKMPTAPEDRTYFFGM